MNKRLQRGALGLVALTALIVVLTGCSAKTYGAQCAFIIGNGVGDSRIPKEVLLPGEKVAKGDDEDYYIPCGPRNFIITDAKDRGDRHDPVVATTGKSEDGQTPGTPMFVFLTAYWTPNQDRETLKQFWAKACFKYTCASNDAQDEGNANFSTPGWNGMLRETVSPSLDRTGSDVMSQFPPDIWNKRADWPKVAAAFEKAFAAELRVSMQSNNVLMGDQRRNLDLLCGTSSPTADTKTADCTPITFSIEKITPQDPAIITLYNQSVTLQQRAAQATAAVGGNKARLDAATALYGSREQAGAALREQDAILACAQSKTTCVVNLGGGQLSPSIPAAR